MSELNSKSERGHLRDLEELLAEKKFQAALTIAEQVVPLFPHSFHIKLIYAKILKSLNRLDDVETVLNVLIKTFPENINLLMEMGEMFELQNKPDMALVNYQKIQFLDPFNHYAKEAIEKIKLKLQRAPTLKINDSNKSNIQNQAYNSKESFKEEDIKEDARIENRLNNEILTVKEANSNEDLELKENLKQQVDQLSRMMFNENIAMNNYKKEFDHELDNIISSSDEKKLLAEMKPLDINLMKTTPIEISRQDFNEEDFAEEIIKDKITEKKQNLINRNSNEENKSPNVSVNSISAIFMNNQAENENELVLIENENPIELEDDSHIINIVELAEQKENNIIEKTIENTNEISNRKKNNSKSTELSDLSDSNEFITESAAKLYCQQKLYDDALNIYKKLYLAKNEQSILEKIEKIKQKKNAESKIKMLNSYLSAIKKRGGQIV
jgi:predicted Zn-dependent protease